MRVKVYIFTSRSSLVDSERMLPVDDHLIRAMHIESIYDVYSYAGCLGLRELTGCVSNDVVFKLKKYGEALVRGHEAEKIAVLLGFSSGVKFVVLRRCGG